MLLVVLLFAAAALPAPGASIGTGSAATDGRLSDKVFWGSRDMFGNLSDSGVRVVDGTEGGGRGRSDIFRNIFAANEDALGVNADEEARELREQAEYTASDDAGEDDDEGVDEEGDSGEDEEDGGGADDGSNPRFRAERQRALLSGRRWSPFRDASKRKTPAGGGGSDPPPMYEKYIKCGKTKKGGQAPPAEKGGCCPWAGYFKLGVECSGHGTCVPILTNSKPQKMRFEDDRGRSQLDAIADGKIRFLETLPSAAFVEIQAALSARSSERALLSARAPMGALNGKSIVLEKSEIIESLGMNAERIMAAADGMEKPPKMKTQKGCGKSGVCARCECQEGWSGDICANDEVLKGTNCSPLDPGCPNQVPMPAVPAPCLGPAALYPLDSPCRSSLRSRQPFPPEDPPEIPNYVPMEELIGEVGANSE
jgi:hypothetical protein